MNEESKTSKVNEENSSLDNYHVYNYLIDKPNLIIALLSASIAAIVVLITTSLYIRESVRLRFWNISLSFVDITNRSSLYGGGIAFSAFILLSLFTIYSYHTFLSFNTYLPYIASAKKQFRELKE